MMNQRQCVFLKGEPEWGRNSARVLLAGFDNANVIVLSEHAEPDSAYKTITQKQAQKQLGKEFDAVVFDATDGFNADSFGAIVGTVKAGGALVVLLPNTMPESLWLTRFNQVADEFAAQYESIHSVQQGDELPILTAPAQKQQLNEVIPTADQTAAINAILKVVHGHRRRPLVLSADRGRGKSAALGMAAAELIKQGKQSIIVTAPSLSCAETIFSHACYALPDATDAKGKLSSGNGLIQFIAPDLLIESDITADIVLVDEAAAIPVQMLEQLLAKFSRLVFSSTIHGYEGTGKGFIVRFKQTLDELTPSWKEFHIEQPVRWREDDALEKFSFDALLLNATPPTVESMTGFEPSECQFEQVGPRRLVSDETMLRALFGLLVQAHYRTRPSDLMMLLDRDDISVYIMHFNGQIIACSVCVEEGELAPELADAIYCGERRLNGHLLPQSLLAHTGMVDAGKYRYRRIIRIAVHPLLQGQTIGQQFVRHLLISATQDKKDFMGASFASSTEVIGFWHQCTFMPVRLGLQHDDVSGSHAMLMLKPLTQQAEMLASQAVSRFTEQWSSLLQHEFQYLKPELVTRISQLLARDTGLLSDSDWHEIKAFAYRQRGYDVCHYTLRQAISAWVSQPVFLKLSSQHQALCILLVLQQHAVSEVAKRLSYRGKAEVISELREAISCLCQ